MMFVMRHFFVLLAIITGTVHAQFSPPLTTINPTGSGLHAYAVQSPANDAAALLRQHLEALTLPNGATVAVVLNERVVIIADTFSVRTETATVGTYLAMAQGTQRDGGALTVTRQPAPPTITRQDTSNLDTVGALLEIVTTAGELTLVQPMTPQTANDIYLTISQGLRGFDCTPLAGAQDVLTVSVNVLVEANAVSLRWVNRQADLTPLTRCLR